MVRFNAVRLCAILLVFSSTFAQANGSKTEVIQVIGLNTKDQDQNYDHFFQEGESMLKYCKSQGLKIPDQCHVYLHDQAPIKPGQKAHEIRKKAAQAGALTRKVSKSEVIENIKKAIANAEPGKQIILSLIDHGSPGGGEGASCIYLNESERLCDEELKTLLKAKKPGVKVFVQAHGCFSGGFTSISSPDVCTYVTSNQKKISYGIPSELFWTPLLNLKKPKEPFTLGKFREQGYRPQLLMRGGGFASQVIKTQVCSEPSANKEKIPPELYQAAQDIRSLWKADCLNPELRLKTQSGNEGESSALACSESNPWLRAIPPGIVNLKDLISDPAVAGDSMFAGFAQKFCNKDAKALLNSKEVKELCESLNTEFEVPKDLKKRLNKAIEILNKARLPLLNEERRLAVELLQTGADQPKIEARRGEILEQLNATTEQFLKDTSGPMAQLHKQLGFVDQRSHILSKIEKVWQSLCIDPSKEVTEEEKQFNPSDYRKAVSNQDVEDAKGCEDSFTL